VWTTIGTVVVDGRALPARDGIVVRHVGEISIAARESTEVVIVEP